MVHSSKYRKLEDYLRMSSKDVVVLSFSEIESIIGFSLPDSAYKYFPFWYSSISQMWINAGYSIERVSRKEQTITLRKKNISSPFASLISERYTCREPSLSVDSAIMLIQNYHSATAEDSHARYLSWVHCYRVFGDYRHALDDKTIDYLSLHLGFYLASWGMYRGSSFLLQKDYKIHIPVVKIIQEAKYDILRGISAAELCKDENLILLEEIGARIRAYYADEKPAFDDRANNATDTLITKILLGTLGCVPAFDTYYCNSVKKHHISSDKYSMESVYCVARYYLTHADVFEVLRCKLNAGQDGIEYPQMKLMDMCFWEDGFEHDRKS